MPAEVVYGLVVLAIAAQTATYLVDVRLLNDSATLFDLQGSGGLFDWVKIALLLVAAGFAILSRPTWQGCMAGVLLGLLAFDDWHQIHNRVPGWELVYLPVFAVLSALLLSLASERGPAARRLVVVALVFLLASLVVHFSGPAFLRAFGWHSGSGPYELKVVLKEAGELAGWILIVAALAPSRDGVERGLAPIRRLWPA